MMENRIKELERSVYLTISAIKLRCAENGNISGWMAANEITRRFPGMPRINQERKPQA